MKLLIQLDDTGAAELDRAAKLIQTLKRNGGSPDGGAHTRKPTGPVAAWFRRLGRGSRSFWERAAKHSRSHREWTFDELAGGSSKEKKRLRSHHRNSYRAIKAEGSADPLNSRWDSGNKRMVYSMPGPVRDDILRLVAS